MCGHDIRPSQSSELAHESHACQDASHISEARDNARHRIVGMNLVLQIDEALVVRCNERFKHLAQRHNAFSYRDLALFALEVREVLHVHVEQSRSYFVDRLDHICASADCMSHIDAATDARIHRLNCLQHIQGRMPQLVLGAMIVNRDADVVLLYEFLNSRERFRSRVPGDNNSDAGSLAVFELGADVCILIFREIDGASSVKLDARRRIVCKRCRLLLRIHWQMVFDVLHIQGKHIELLHEADHLRAAEVAERVAGQAQTNRCCFFSGRMCVSNCYYVPRHRECRSDERTGANETATGETVFTRHVVPNRSRTRGPTSSSLPDHSGSVRLLCRDVIRAGLPTRCWKVAAWSQ